MSKVSEIAVSDVRFVKELYPRVKPSDEVIDRYVDAIDKLPPIVVARDGVLVDGFHRWQAHLREGVESIAAEHLGDLTDSEILRESYRRNATHGHSLSTTDKRRAADHLYRALADLAPDERYAEIAADLGITESTAKKYANQARQDEKAEQKAKAWDLHLDCWTQQAIADQIGVTQQTIGNWVQDLESDSRFCTAPESRQHFDVWQFHTTTSDSAYFGHMPPQVVENLLWLYTEPGQVVVDPFAGSGTTIDVAKSMGRRVWASDRASAAKYPTLPIHTHDITTGWPDDAPAKADLILLDPPYWKQAEGRYSDDDDDLGNQTLDDFYANWSKVVATCADKLAKGGRLAYIISPTEDGDRVIDHATDMLRACWDAGLTVERRVIVTYSTQQATGQQVTWARDNRRLLKLYRDLVVLS